MLLDTNVCIDALRGRQSVVEKFCRERPEDLAISVVTGFELIQGAERAPEEYREEERRKVSRFLSKLQQVDFSSDAARLAGEINAALLNAGTPISLADVFIAATAKQMNLPLVTNNTRDFEKIGGVILQDWRR